MKHTIKEAIKLYDAHKKGRVIQRTEYPYLRWENIEDFNENYVLEGRYKYRVFPYFRLPTEEEFESITQEFTKVDYDKKSRVYLDEKSGNKLQFYYIRLWEKEDLIVRGKQCFCWCSNPTDREIEHLLARTFDGFDIAIVDMNTERSVRLVSDEPFEGGIKFGDVWWKPENEKGFYTWREAIEKFNK